MWLIVSNHNTTFTLFICIYKCSANAKHQFLLHFINVATYCSVVPGNTRWNLAVIEFNRIWEHAPSFSQEWTQHKRRDQKKNHLVNKKYATLLCSSLTRWPLHPLKLTGCLFVLLRARIREATGTIYKFIPWFDPARGKLHTSDKTTAPTAAMSGSKQDHPKRLLWCILNLKRNTAFVLIVEASCGVFCSIQVGVLLLLPPWYSFLTFLTEQHLFWSTCTWQSCGINAPVPMADTSNVCWGLESR